MNHSASAQRARALTVGFLLAFVVMTIATFMNESVSNKGQLVAGNLADSEKFPSTFNALHGAGSNPMVAAMGSYVWWIGVLFLGLLFTWMALKMTRRYV